MFLKYKLAKLIGAITGKHCKDCKHYRGICCDNTKKPECSANIFPIGWEKKEGDTE